MSGGIFKEAFFGVIQMKINSIFRKYPEGWSDGERWKVKGERWKVINQGKTYASFLSFSLLNGAARLWPFIFRL
jgi:hypothetical protein